MNIAYDIPLLHKYLDLRFKNMELDCMNWKVINSSLGLGLELKMIIRTSSGEFQQRNFQIKLNPDLIELVIS